MIKRIIFIVIFFWVSESFSQEASYYLEQAGKIQRKSGFFAIALFEKALEMELNSKQKSIVIGKLFDLYLRNAKIEEIMLLGKEHELDKAREAKLKHLNNTLARNIGMEEAHFKEFIECLLSKDYNSRKKLLGFYVADKSIYILNYIFAIKYKLKDYESLGYLISEAPDMSPSLRLAYLIKTNSKDVERKLRDFSRISDLTDDQRMELLFLYGIHLQKQRRYKQSARYFRMSASFDKRKTNYAKMGIVEAAKSLFITGKAPQACHLLGNAKINVQNETDELLKFYCDSKNPKKDLKKFEPAIEVLAQQENGILFRSYKTFYGQDSNENEEKNNAEKP
jgi:hypothetical protein